MMEDKARDVERIKMLEQCRESGELKSSRKEMTERVTVASRQFMVMDVDFGTEITDRKELIALAKTKMADKVRADKVRVEKVRADKVRADKVRVDKVRVDKVRADKVRADKVRADKVRADKVRADKERSDK
jgi:hypothetical protein